MKKFSATHFEVVVWEGKRIGLHMGVYSREWRNRRIPIPAPKPLDEEILDRVRAQACKPIRPPWW